MNDQLSVIIYLCSAESWSGWLAVVGGLPVDSSSDWSNEELDWALLTNQGTFHSVYCTLLAKFWRISLYSM